jgi:hypothetical protein
MSGGCSSYWANTATAVNVPGALDRPTLGSRHVVTRARSRPSGVPGQDPG